MKIFLKELLKVLSGIIAGIAVGWFIVIPLLFPKPTPTLYECPCESEELIKDVVRHTNKDGMKSVTTFVDVKGCLIVKE
jgi:hypothetical protein